MQKRVRSNCIVLIILVMMAVSATAGTHQFLF